MPEAGIYAALMADSTVSGLNGGRIYPLLLPEDPTLPATTYQRISMRTLDTLDGPADFTVVRLQVDQWANTYADAQALADATDAVLEGFTGALPDKTQVFDIQIARGQDQFEEQARVYRASRDYLIQYAR